MKKNNLIWIIYVVVVFFYGTVYAQTNAKLDSILNYNFAVLDSVAVGLKEQHHLNPRQAAFLYLIDGWVNSNTSFSHYEGIKFGKKNTEIWKSWYSKNSCRIDPDEFYKEMNIHYTFFHEGLVPDSVFLYVEKIDKKYKGL